MGRRFKHHTSGSLFITLLSITIAHGFTSSLGGGLLNNSGGTVILVGCTFTGNRGSSGGGIANLNGGTMNLQNSTITNNTTTEVGGGGVVNFGTTFITASTITNNTSGGEVAVSPILAQQTLPPASSLTIQARREVALPLKT